MSHLTPRESQILTLTATGMTKREVGQQLYITEPTVKTHLAHTYKVLGAHNAAHAVALALAEGLIPAPRKGD
jgi:DNA-binding CsgD family transcriptional regulator